MDHVQTGAWLKSARELHEISAEAISDVLHVSVQSVHNWESGKLPKPARFAELEGAYRLPAGAISGALYGTNASGSLDYWIGRWEQSTAHLQRVLAEQIDLVALMKSERRNPHEDAKLAKTAESTIRAAAAKQESRKLPKQSSAKG